MTVLLTIVATVAYILIGGFLATKMAINEFALVALIFFWPLVAVALAFVVVGAGISILIEKVTGKKIIQ